QYSDLYSTRIATFKEQIDFLASNFDLVSIDDVLAPRRGSNGRRLASITFDDGFLSVKEIAFPYVWAKGIPVTVFACRRAIKNNELFNLPQRRTYESRVYLNEADLKYLSERGVVIGSHTANHKVLAACNGAELREEVLENKAYLEGVTGQKVVHLALPF